MGFRPPHQRSLPSGPAEHVRPSRSFLNEHLTQDTDRFPHQRHHVDVLALEVARQHYEERLFEIHIGCGGNFDHSPGRQPVRSSSR